MYIKPVERRAVSDKGIHRPVYGQQVTNFSQAIYRTNALRRGRLNRALPTSEIPLALLGEGYLLGMDGEIMQLLILNGMCDVLSSDEKHIFVDNQNAQYIRVKKTPELDCVISVLKAGVFTENDVLRTIKQSNLNWTQAKSILKFLFEKGIIVLRYFPDLEDYHVLNNYAIPEMYYDGRFGQIISWLSAFESPNENRFELFERIKKLNILFVGLGALGSHIAVLCASTGVGKVVLVDGDKVKKENLTRQIYYKESQSGTCYKTHAMKQFLVDLNSEVQVVTREEYVTDSSVIEGIIKQEGIDLVIQTADTPQGSIDRYVTLACIKCNTSVLYVHYGNIGPFFIPHKSACFFCLENQINKKSNNIYEEVVELYRNMPSVPSPSYPAGPMLPAHYIYDEIIRFASKIHKPYSINHYYELHGLEGVKMISCPQYSLCRCNEV